MPIPSIICRGKNLHLATMKQFFAALPLRAMPKDEFLDYAEKRMTGFRQTHSQIARQMGLYYCDENNVCHPRFSQVKSLDQILSYCRYWAEHYFVPNPYTPSFPDSCYPTCVYGYVVANCEKYDGELDKILFSIFNQRLNEGDKVKAYLLQFTGIIEDKNGRLVCDKLPTVGTSITLNRSNELAYFHYYDAWEQDSSVESIEESRKKEFYGWLIAKKLTPDYADDLVNSYLVCLSDELKMPPVKTAWHGLREYLYGEKPGKSIYAVADSHELIQYYGEIDRLFAKVADPGPLDATRFNECRAWADSKDNNRAVRAAWIQYKDFMQWRDAQNSKEGFSKNVDLLSIALKIFAEKRYAEEWQGKTRKDGYQSVYAIADMTPEQIAAGSPDDFYNNFLLKIWAFQNGGCRNYGQLGETDKTAYRQFVVDLKTQLKSFDAYFPPSKMCPTGMGVGMLTEIMMRFWPKSCCNYNESLIHDAMVTLGLFKGDFVWPKTPSIYQDFMGKCATILRKMEQMKLPRRPEPDNNEPPDYITVNEFLWFVHDYKDLIKEEVMKKQMKEVHADVISAAGKKLALNAGSKEDLLMLRLMSSLRAKPFVILAGHSGTGKSRIVRKLAYMTCNVKELQDENEGPLNFCMVQVKPNWHDSADLLGYRSAIKDNEYIGTKLVKFLFRAYAYPNTPFFLCLDEMNLAPVEQYFAEF